MKALILAAGKGERLKNLTTDRPKALVQVAGRPLIDHVLDFLDDPEITKIGIVGGYKSDILMKYLQRPKDPKTQRPFDSSASGGLAQGKLKHFNNPFFSEGSVRTIMTAIDFLDTDFVLLNADHIYPKKMFNIYRSKWKGLTIACDFDRNLADDDMKIKLNSDGILTKIRKDLTDFDGGYIGSSFIPKEKLKDYKEALFATYKICGSQSNAEAVIGYMAENGHQISIADLSGIGWLEVDTQEDLEKAEMNLWNF